MPIKPAQPLSARSAPAERAPLIAHIIYRLDVGGMENGLVNLINAIPAQRYRHAIICLTEYTDFRLRIQRPDVAIYALHKRPGKDIGVYPRLWRLLRRLRPDIVHTRNLPALDCLVPAALAGVAARVHGEHGRDMIDLDGSNRKYNLLRRLLRPFAQRYIPLSRDLEIWLRDCIGISPDRIDRIYNGVDMLRFHPPADGRAPLPLAGFAAADSIVIGTVGRMQTVKDQTTLVTAFLSLLERVPELRQRLRLVLIGDGPLRATALQQLQQAGVAAQAWLPGARDDIPELMRGLDIFVLPSLAEGISNTILEAMACGLPVVATRVGGNAELVEEGHSGALVPAADPEALAAALCVYVRDLSLARRHGAAGRRRVENSFSLPAMVDGYLAVYDRLLGRQPTISG